jgi:membrane protein
MDALNNAYDLDKDPRPWWKKKLIAVACLIGVGALFVIATVIMIAGGDIVDTIADQLRIGAAGRWIWTVLQYGFALSLLIGTGWIVYYFLPAVPQHKGHALAGSIVATGLWLIVTLGFRLYVQNFGSYNKTYGTIGGVIVLLTWMYLSMVVLLIGGELASELRVGTGAVRSRAGHLYDGRISTGGPTDRPSVESVHRVPTTSTRPLPERTAPSTDRAPRPAYVARPPRAD